MGTETAPTSCCASLEHDTLHPPLQNTCAFWPTAPLLVALGAAAWAQLLQVRRLVSVTAALARQLGSSDNEIILHNKNEM